MNEKYLIVDLDDSLISWDISFLSLFLALRKKPLLLFKLPFWIISKKKAFVKEYLARKSVSFIDPSSFPLHPDVVLLIKEKKKENIPVYLVSASQNLLIQKFHKAHDLCDKAFGSSVENQYKGENKLRFIEKICSGQSFSYVGDAFVDLRIWKAQNCKTCYVVNRRKGLVNAVKKLKKPFVVINRLEANYSLFSQFIIRPYTSFYFTFFFTLLYFKFYSFEKNILPGTVLCFTSCLFHFAANLLGDLFYIQEKENEISFKSPVVLGVFSFQKTLNICFFSGFFATFLCLFYLPKYFLFFYLIKIFFDLKLENPDCLALKKFFYTFCSQVIFGYMLFSLLSVLRV